LQGVIFCLEWLADLLGTLSARLKTIG
jgi:hypothetical protein